MKKGAKVSRARGGIDNNNNNDNNKTFISFNSLCLIGFPSWPLACFRKLDGFWINVLKKKCESEIRFSRPLTSDVKNI